MANEEQIRIRMGGVFADLLGGALRGVAGGALDEHLERLRNGKVDRESLDLLRSYLREQLGHAPGDFYTRDHENVPISLVGALLGNPESGMGGVITKVAVYQGQVPGEANASLHLQAPGTVGIYHGGRTQVMTISYGKQGIISVHAVKTSEDKLGMREIIDAFGIEGHVESKVVLPDARLVVVPIVGTRNPRDRAYGRRVEDVATKGLGGAVAAYELQRHSA